MAHAHDLSSQEAEAGGPQDLGQAGLSQTNKIISNI